MAIATAVGTHHSTYHLEGKSFPVLDDPAVKALMGDADGWHIASEAHRPMALAKLLGSGMPASDCAAPLLSCLYSRTETMKGLLAAMHNFNPAQAKVARDILHADFDIARKRFSDWKSEQSGNVDHYSPDNLIALLETKLK